MQLQPNRQQAIKRMRSNRGAIFGVSLCLILTPILIWACLSMIQIGLAGSYKTRLTFIGQQAATYAVNADPGQPLDCTTKAIVEKLLLCHGLRATALSVRVRNVVSGDCDALRVEVTANLPLIPVHGMPFPWTIPVHANAMATMALNRLCGGIAVSPNPSRGQQVDPTASLYLPIVRPDNQLPVWEFAYGDSGIFPGENIPYDVTLHDLHILGDNAPEIAPSTDNQTLAVRRSLY